MTRGLAAVLLAVCLAGCLAGCGSTTPAEPEPESPTSETPTPSPSPTRAGKPPPAPGVGDCYGLGYARVVAPTTTRSRATPCDGSHTTETFHVGTLDRVIAGRLLAVDSRRLQDQVATACPQLLPQHVGGTDEQRRLSMLRSVWFTPTLPQSDAGADWFRCDVIALARDSQLLEVTGSLSGVLDSEAGRDRYGMCGTAEPGTDGFERVACSQTHTWRALRTVPLTDAGDPGDYPGEAAAERAGEEPCRAAGRAAAPDPLDFQWGYEWPTATQWASGQTYGICWVPDAG